MTRSVLTLKLQHKLVWLRWPLILVMVCTAGIVYFTQYQSHNRIYKQNTQIHSPTATQKFIKNENPAVQSTQLTLLLSEENKIKLEKEKNTAAKLEKEKEKIEEKSDDDTKTTSEMPKIPHILHQIFKDDQVPVMYRVPITSWLHNHPQWIYYFWSDTDAERLVKERYPTYLKLYQSYSHGLQKSDVLRYFMLHAVGGVYADMDVKNIKPMEPLLEGKSCIVTPEPSLQTKMIFNYASTLTNAIMACSKGHPYMEHVITELEAASKKMKEKNGILFSTGPFFLNSTYNSYIQKYPECISPTSSCHVTVVSEKYLDPDMDNPMLGLRRTFCRDESQTKGRYQVEACKELEKMNYRAPSQLKDAYTDHLWYHFGWSSEKEKKRRTKRNINTIVTRRKIMRYQSEP